MLDQVPRKSATGSKLRMLIAYSKTSTQVQTTLDYLVMIGKHLGFETKFAHVTNDAHIAFDLNEFDVVFNSYCVRHCFPGYVSKSYLDALREFRGLKIIAFQDEYDHTNLLKNAIKEFGFHIVLTCVPQRAIEFVYPRSEFPGVAFFTVFTGYVSDELSSISTGVKPVRDRSIVVGYRGRDIGGKYGRLGFDKFEIGRRMKIECDKRGVPNDIAMDEGSRLYGSAWYDFVGNCRTMLGSESGSNVFDFDGALNAKHAEITKANGGIAPSYEEFKAFSEPLEAPTGMGQISPRVFECAAFRTPMLLFRGGYSDVLTPDKHYIAIEKDFSNIDDVIKRVHDLDELQRMADRAHADLIASGRFTYRALCQSLRSLIDERLNAAPNEEFATGRSVRPQTIVRPPPDSVEEVLAERPTEQPRGLREFYITQNWRHAGHYVAEAGRVDQSVQLEVSTRNKAIQLIRDDRNLGVDVVIAEACDLYFQEVKKLADGRIKYRGALADLERKMEAARSSEDWDLLAEAGAAKSALSLEWIKACQASYARFESAYNEVMKRARVLRPTTALSIIVRETLNSPAWLVRRVVRAGIRIVRPVIRALFRLAIAILPRRWREAALRRAGLIASRLQASFSRFR